MITVCVFALILNVYICAWILNVLLDVTCKCTDTECMCINTEGTCMYTEWMCMDTVS